MAKKYECKRTPEGVVCFVALTGRGGYFLKNVGYHSPDGFEMGYAGSGPADLALTILCDHLGVKDASRKTYLGKGHESKESGKAWLYHQDFKFEFITPHHASTTISTEQIQAWIEKEYRCRV